MNIDAAMFSLYNYQLILFILPTLLHFCVSLAVVLAQEGPHVPALHY
jgi:hypothetical protein